ncbi:hypothetical protein H4J58_18815 [Colwellia sp. MB3u-70]|uniref:hypothetical protein n=1 Tax=unclassified Colwellia TaxID=196834 RepID=UPI0015F733E4|nr:MULTISPECIES: hypothetical protein [unclassified Colwellia]MBA6291669.1 hypothetical protein [Colwellia sp. MB3u-8]MBA6309152.1 hypothetical protein [Colwellia sp. MB3u-70]
MNKSLLMAVFAGLTLGGCTHRMADVTYISTKAVNQEQISTASTDNVRVTGEDMKQIIVFIPTGRPDMKEALDNAIETKPCGIALKDVTLTSHSWYIPYIYGQRKIIAEGKVLEDRNCLAKQSNKSTTTPLATTSESTSTTAN